MPCRVLVLVVSPQSMALEWVQEEYAYAIGQHKRVILVLLRDAVMPGFLQSRHWVACRDAEQYDERVRQLAHGIMEVESLAYLPYQHQRSPHHAPRVCVRAGSKPEGVSRRAPSSLG
jgi:hypothetical protein